MQDSTVENKWKPQAEWQARNNYVSKGYRVYENVLNAFSEACEKNGDKKSTVINKRMLDYIDQTNKSTEKIPLVMDFIGKPHGKVTRTLRFYKETIDEFTIACEKNGVTPGNVVCQFMYEYAQEQKAKNEKIHIKSSILLDAELRRIKKLYEKPTPKSKEKMGV